MKRQITITITETSVGVTHALRITDDGHVIVTKKSVRKWGVTAPKSPDTLLVRALFGAVNIAVRDWMRQSELPF
uniref:Uncharacterized protein n=1 Tax=uncultured prokaryote TaxID=198431 RepID=A0A0H5Q5G7_9ZZZZ|nr:hypothetical protein [uncultured prokaryote]